MTIDPRAARALRAARTRLRDIAAAEHFDSMDTRERAADRLASEHDLLATRITQAATELAAAKTVHDLMFVAELVSEQRGAIAVAQRAHADASATVDRAADRLRDRTRQLRTAEKIVDMVETARETAEAKTEQRAADDLAGPKAQARPK